MQLTLLITYAIIICQTQMIEEAYCISLTFEGSTRVQIYLSNFMQAKLPKLTVADHVSVVHTYFAPHMPRELCTIVLATSRR